ncbi:MULTISPECIES: hypothetical protein [Achromobacter]|jgi:hypothetical protein|uniref:DUF4926 domain-containing protein n=1 Tax=Achromobacter spanius TaxID=217203 RepID=A0A2K8S0B8_9BURK|nr:MULTISPECIES: hypothetical protein [Achromobacter]SPT41704.1 Uncharacterised protein [Achromobacter denitrificans]AUA56040.1 hypothetical protein CVS48_08340 [Achromobacter spanius]MDH0735469.1 hypothetical protein [Achromobacter spanius]MDQ6211496.1 hypothetical protein [Achromobacter insolitus]PPA77582.1 hypothetical protein C4E15_06095 [Achromobacter spanius]
MNILSPWINKLAVGSKAMHARLGDVTVLAVCGEEREDREVESVFLDADGNTLMVIEVVSAAELSEIDPCRDLAPRRTATATILPFKAASPQ